MKIEDFNYLPKEWAFHIVAQWEKENLPFKKRTHFDCCLGFLDKDYYNFLNNLIKFQEIYKKYYKKYKKKKSKLEIINIQNKWIKNASNFIIIQENHIKQLKNELNNLKKLQKYKNKKI